MHLEKNFREVSQPWSSSDDSISDDFVQRADSRRPASAKLIDSSHAPSIRARDFVYEPQITSVELH